MAVAPTKSYIRLQSGGSMTGASPVTTTHGRVADSIVVTGLAPVMPLPQPLYE